MIIKKITRDLNPTQSLKFYTGYEDFFNLTMCICLKSKIYALNFKEKIVQI